MKEIYKERDISNYAYLLKSGKIFLDILDMSYEIQDSNLIVGSAEIIIGYGSSVPIFRLCNMKANDDTVLEPIKADVLKGLIHRYNVGFNLNKFLAEFLAILTNIQSELKADVSKDKDLRNQHAKLYYELVENLYQLAQEIKFPDIMEIVKYSKEELLYETGKILSKKKRYSFSNQQKFHLF